MTWVFGVMLLLGGGFLLISSLIGAVSDFAEGLFEGVDDALESVGVDIIPDAFHLDAGEAGEDAHGIGCSVIAAFFAGFGAIGLVTTLFDLPIIWSLIFAAVFGILVGWLYIWLMRVIQRQQSNSLVSTDDIVGSTGRVTIAIPTGNEAGQVMITVRSENRIFVAYDDEKNGLPKGTQVSVTSYQGGRIYVKQIT